MDLDDLLKPSEATSIHLSLDDHQINALQGVQPGESIFLAPGEDEDQGMAVIVRTLKGSILEVSALYLIGLTPLREITNTVPISGQRRLSRGYIPTGNVYRGTEAIRRYISPD